MTEKTRPPPADATADPAPAPTTTGPTTKAWTFSSRGDPSAVLHLTTTHPMPTLPPTLTPKQSKHLAHLLSEPWLLIRVSHAALNPGTLFYLRMIPTCAHAAPAVPEMDFSGVVTQVWSPDPSTPYPSTTTPADEVEAKSNPARMFGVGDAVIGFVPVGFAWPTGTGALAGHVAVPARYVVKKPRTDLTRELQGGGAGLILASLVARSVLLDAKVEKGQRVLVNGASGGIGTFGVQMARDAVGEEGYVVAVCSGRNAELVKGLGADEVIDYQQHESLPTELSRRYLPSQPFDAVMDCVGVHSLYLGSSLFLKEGGVYSSVGVKLESWTWGDGIRAVWKMQMNALWPRARWLGGTGREWKCGTVMSPSVEDMEVVVGMLGEGRIRVVVDSEWRFKDVKEAFALLESKRARGKILIKVDEDAK